MPFRVPFVCLALALTAVPANATRIHVEDSHKIVRISDPQISPDGKTIAIVIGHANLDEDRTDSELDLVDVTTKTMRVLSRKPHAGFPRWSPDGHTLAFLAEDDKHNLQIFTLAIDAGGESQQLTHSPTSIEQIAWRPDGHALAFVAEDEAPERKGQAKFADALEIGNNDFLAHDKQMPAHLWLVDLPADASTDAPKPKRLTSGSWSLVISLPPGPPASPIQWTPDGKSIYFVRVPTPLSGDGTASTVQLLDVATGRDKAVTGQTMYESVPVLSPDGSQLTYLRNRDGKAQNENDVFLTAPSGGPGKAITKQIDRNIVRQIWMPDGKSLLVAANDATTSGLWIQPAAGGPAQRLSTGDITPTVPFWLDGTVGAHGELAFTGTTPTSPPELFYMGSTTAAPIQLTHLNAEVASREMARQESFAWPSMKGGPQSDGVLTYPIGFQSGKKYPLVLYIHGGPTSSSKQSFSFFSQLFAAQGWLVFEPNYRGSDNLGNAYQAAIFNDAGKGPGEDVMAGLAVLRKRGFVDEQNIAVSGWSYGGFMTSWLLGHSTLWKASVDGAAVNDWIDMYDLSDGNITVADGFGGSPYTSPERLAAYRAQSPITYVSAVRTPTLVLCDVGDYRVPITQSYAWYRALKDNGVVTQFIAFPIGGHNPTDPLRREDMMRRWIQWLGHYLPSDPNAEAAPPAK